MNSSENGGLDTQHARFPFCCSQPAFLTQWHPLNSRRSSHRRWFKSILLFIKATYKKGGLPKPFLVGDTEPQIDQFFLNTFFSFTVQSITTTKYMLVPLQKKLKIKGPGTCGRVRLKSNSSSVPRHLFSGRLGYRCKRWPKEMETTPGQRSTSNVNKLRWLVLGKNNNWNWLENLETWVWFPSVDQKTSSTSVSEGGASARSPISSQIWHHCGFFFFYIVWNTLNIWTRRKIKQNFLN